MKIRLLFISCLISVYVNAQVKFYPIEIKGKWGYMDKLGNMVIQPMYDYADDFNEGFAVVALKNLPCVINSKNERVVDTSVFQFISGYSDGLASARDFQQKKFYINTKGEKVITLPDEVYEARKFKNGYACVSKQVDEHLLKFQHDIVTLGYRFGYIDKTGKQAIDFIYEDADDFDKNGLARVKVKNKFGIINAKGEFVLPAEYGNIDQFYEDRAVVDAMGKYGYTDTKGMIVIKPQFDMAYDFCDGLAAVADLKAKKFGFINSEGQIVIPVIYDDVKPFSEGKAAVFKDGKWGFIDKNGKLIVLNVFDNASVFSEDRCAVLVKRKWGFIDETGRLVIPAEYDAVGSFDNGVADVVYHGISAYVNLSGNILPILKK